MPTPSETLKETLMAIARAICQNTKEPTIDFDTTTMRMKLQVAKDDQGRCVGKNGTMIWALSAMMWWAGSAQLMQPVTVDLLEPDTRRGSSKPSMPYREVSPTQAHKQSIGTLLDTITKAVFKTTVPYVILAGPTLKIEIQLPKYLQTSMQEPNFAEALDLVLVAACRAKGITAQTEITWG
jgi:predicted RNA-binding protein YlqC (UPF0109 family)